MSYPILRIEIIRESIDSKPFCKSIDVYESMRAEIDTLDREHFYVLCLNAKNKIIGKNLISIGSLTATIVHPREVFKGAILSNAVSIILVHNHPSGDSAPSPEDRAITKKMVGAGELLGIPVLDHIIIGDNEFYSFTDNRMGRLI